MDPDQTAPIGAVWSGFALFEQEASKTVRQMTFAVIGTLRVNKHPVHPEICLLMWVILKDSFY